MTLNASRHSPTINATPGTGCSGTTPVTAYDAATVPQNVRITYAVTIPVKPMNFPAKIYWRAMGFVAMA